MRFEKVHSNLKRRKISFSIHLDLGFDFASADADVSFPLLVDAKKFDSHASDGLATRPRPVKMKFRHFNQFNELKWWLM